jgi:D-sedoheptulose 7-phosphate isomerase
MIREIKYSQYFKKISKNLQSFDYKKIESLRKKISSLNKNNKIILIGNGGSASISNHVAVDITKILKKRAVTFNEPNLITCFANDYGYEKWAEKALEAYALKDDVIILISSSGKSKNIINAAKYAKKNDIYLATLTGFKKNNPVSKLGNENLWINSTEYNVIEMVHHIWLLSIVDLIQTKKI